MGLFDFFKKGNKSPNKEKKVKSEQKNVLNDALLHALQSSDWRVRKSAVEKLTDQITLNNIAKNDSAHQVYQAAIEKVLNQNVLADIAINSNDSNRRYCAVLRITDQKILANVAVNSKDEDALIEVVKKIEDKSLLENIARNNEYYRVRAEAVMKLDNQSLLSYIAENDTDSYPRKEAVKKITDQEVLYRIAKNDKDKFVRKAATDRLTSQKHLSEIAQNDKDYGVRLQAVVNKNMKDQTVLEHIVKNDKKGQVRMAAADKIADASIAQIGYIYAAQYDDEWIMRQIAVKKVTDQEVIKSILKNETENSVRVIAIGQLSDKNLAKKLYIEIAKNDREREPYAKMMLSKLGELSVFSTPYELCKTIDRLSTGEEGINILLNYMDRVNSWEKKDRGYYFYLLARNSKNIGCKAASYAFYAADIANRPESTTFGWNVLKSAGILPATTKPSPEIAKKLHEKYPIPKTIQKIKNYQLPK
ncbi:MAG: hypothetical protein GX963_05180 [Bacteroidales bacterium]|nr:hypothetical protein [Bacteroidales bacterium]